MGAQPYIANQFHLILKFKWYEVGKQKNTQKFYLVGNNQKKKSS